MFQFCVVIIVVANLWGTTRATFARRSPTRGVLLKMWESLVLNRFSILYIWKDRIHVSALLLLSIGNPAPRNGDRQSLGACTRCITIVPHRYENRDWAYNSSQHPTTRFSKTNSEWCWNLWFGFRCLNACCLSCLFVGDQPHRRTTTSWQ